MARWANVNAIVSFVTLGISLISAIIAFGKANNALSAGGNLVGVLITAAVSLLLNITLLHAASNITKGIDSSDQGFFGIGLTKLATYFKIMGIIIIVALGIVVLAMLFVMVISLAR